MILNKPMSLSNFKWFRKLKGGHWQQWLIDSPVYSKLWFRTQTKPSPLAISLLKEEYHRTVILDLLFSTFKWYRKFKGGHWEKWYLDFPVSAFCWFQLDTCSHFSKRPDILCRGTPTCEDHPL